MNFQRTILFSLCLCFFVNTWCTAQENELIAEGAKLELVSDDFTFTEGPAADVSGNVYFTDQPSNKILKWTAADNSIAVFMEGAGRANGLYFDHEGNLLACTDEDSQVWKIDESKTVEIIVSDFRGKRLNGPNDLWVDPNGGIYITDPYYQRDYWQRKEKEIAEERVYYLAPGAKELRIATSELVKPNGIIGTPDGKTLYVADIGDNSTWSFNIAEDGSLTDKTLFAELGSDGMTIDACGNIYLTGDGVTIFSPEGKQIEQIEVERDWTANATFGGKEKQTLFITAMNSVFTLKMRVHGGQ